MIPQATLTEKQNMPINIPSPLPFQRKALSIDKLSWLSPEEYCEIENTISKGSLAQRQKIRLKSLAKQFIGKYPTPKQWLEIPPKDHPVIKRDDMLETNYIVHWAINSKIAKGDDPIARKYQTFLANFFTLRRCVKLIEYSLYYGFLTQEEIVMASLMPKGDCMILGLARHTLVLSKPLKKFTVEDVKLYKYMVSPASKRTYLLKNLLQLMRQLKIDLNYDEFEPPELKFDVVEFKKNRYIQGITDWLTPEEHGNIIGCHDSTSDEARKGKMSANRKIASDFLKVYPTPEDWWDIPLKQRIDKKYKFDEFVRYDETGFIINWVCTTPIYNDCDIRERQLQLASYFDQRHTYCNYVKWSTFYGLITDEEIVKVKELYSFEHSVLVGLSIHAIILQKAVKDFKQEDLWLIPYIRSEQTYSEKRVLDTLFYLGYWQTPGKMNFKTNFDIAKAHPQWGHIAENYYGYLTRGFATEQVIGSRGRLIKKLFDYLEQNDLPDCSMFDFDAFLSLIEHLRIGTRVEKISEATLSKRLLGIKGFMDWGINKCQERDPFFPEKLDFPNDEITRTARKSLEEYVKTDGLAFPEDDPEFPELLVNAIKDYKPQDEIEELCRNFWLVLASCPIRFSTLLYLQANDPMLPMMNAPEVWGLYSEPSDKAGNRNGQFPIIDPLGVEAVKVLEARAKRIGLRPMHNRLKQRTYIHLFGLPKSPWILPRWEITQFLNKVKDCIPGGRSKKGTAHSFRHLLATHIAVMTGNMDLVQLALGHRYFSMTKLYLRSKISRKSLLWAMFKKYKNNELSGKFYFALFELLAGNDVSNDEMLRALRLEELTLEQFLEKYGVPAATGCGKCMNQQPCPWHADDACLGCRHWILRKTDVPFAIASLARMFRTMQKMVIGSINFSYENPKAKALMSNITALNVYIQNLGFSDEFIEDLLKSELVKQVSRESAK